MRRTLIVAGALLVLSPLAVGLAQQTFQPPSFDAKVYENAELGFSFHYPADFLEQHTPPGLVLPEAKLLLVGVSPQQLPALVRDCCSSDTHCR